MDTEDQAQAHKDEEVYVKLQIQVPVLMITGNKTDFEAKKESQAALKHIVSSNQNRPTSTPFQKLQKLRLIDFSIIIRLISIVRFLINSVIFNRPKILIMVKNWLK